MSVGKGKRYAGPCKWCESCTDREGDICTLLYKEVALYKSEKKNAWHISQGGITMKTIKTSKPCIMLDLMLECDKVHRAHDNICILMTEGLYSVLLEVFHDPQMLQTMVETYLGATLRVVDGDHLYYWISPDWGKVEVLDE